MNERRGSLAACDPPGSGIRWGLGGILAAGVLLRLAAFLVLRPQPESDYLVYFELASQLADGNVMRSALGQVAFMSGGYPLLLGNWFGAFGKELLVGHLLNLSLFVVSGLALYCATVAVARSRAAGLVCVAIWSVYLESIVYSTYLAKENLLVALLAIQVLLLARPDAHRPRMAITGGAIFGCGLVAGTAYVGFLPAVVVGLWRRCASTRQFVLAMALFCVAAGVAVGPWAARNDDLLGRPVITTNGGWNLWVGNNPAATGEFVSATEIPGGDQYLRIMRERGELAADDFAGARAREFILARPVDAASLALRKLMLFWKPPVHDGHKRLHPAEPFVRGVWAAQYLLLLAGFVAWLRWAPTNATDRETGSSDFRLPMLVAVVGYWVLHGAVYIIFRYRFSIMPVMAIGAACIVVELGRRLAVSRRHRLAAGS